MNMNLLARVCLHSANRAMHLALTATAPASRAYWTYSAAAWMRHMRDVLMSDAEPRLNLSLLRPEIWPVERPNEQPIPADVEALIEVGLMYVEDAGNGWRRLGLTVEVNLGDDPPKGHA